MQNPPVARGQFQTYQMVMSATTALNILSDVLQFRAVMMIVDNFTNQYIRVPDANNTFIPPNVQRYPVHFPQATNRVNISATAAADTPPSVTAAAVTAGQIAFFTFLEDDVNTSAVSQQISVVANTSVDGTLINVASTITQATSTTATLSSLFLAAAAGLRLLGWNIKENAGASAEVILNHGASTSNVEVMDRTLVIGESFTDWFGLDGIGIPNGLSIQRVSGNTKVVIYSKTVA